MNYPTETIWAVAADHFAPIADALKSIDVKSAAATATPKPRSGPGYQNVGGVAVIPLNGILQKTDSILSLFFDTTSTQDFAAAVSKAASDPAVNAILIRCDSPGGSARGVSDAADAVWAARQSKPVYAFAEDCCCSGAFWICSQAQKLSANSTAAIGSIGTFIALPDTSVAAERMGVQMHVIKSNGAAFKGAGTPGTKIEPSHIAEMQRMVDGIQSEFNKGISRGRGISLARAEQMATGQIFIGEQAARQALVDKTGSFENVLAGLQSKTTAAASPPAITPRAISSVQLSHTPQQFAKAFSTLVAEEMKTSNCSRPQAIATIAKRSPELHAEFLKASNGDAARDCETTNYKR